MDDQPAETPVLCALRDAAAAAARVGAGAAGLGVGERRALLAEVDRASAVLATVRGQLLLAERQAGTWQGRGDGSFAAWRGRTSREGARAAAAEERQAETLAAMPGLREATVAGRVSLAHVDVVARAAATGSAAVRTALGSAPVQNGLTDLATRLDAARFATAVARLAARTDAAALEHNHQAQRAARYLHLADAADGTRISGRLDRMAGYRLRLALEALTPRPAADDDRTPEQRRADALATMADKLLSLPDTVPGAAQTPHVSFLMSAEAWAALRGAQRAAGPGVEGAGTEGAGAEDTGAVADAGADGLAGLLAAAGPMEPVTMEDGTPVPPSEVARALCDCELTRIVLDAADEPLNLGRTERRYTGPQRRAVIARDGGCFWDGCTMAPRWLEVHHLDWWERDGGETSVVDGVAACSYHHHEVHRRDLVVRRVPLDPQEKGTGSRRVRYVVATRDGRLANGPPPMSSRQGPARRGTQPAPPPRATVPAPPPTLGGLSLAV